VEKEDSLKLTSEPESSKSVPNAPTGKPKKPKTFNFKSFIIQLLRRGTYRYKPRNDALKDAKIARNQYKCATCSGIFGRKDVQIDHTDPVVSVETGFVDWNTYITRMYPEKQGFQILCSQCHSNKCLLEKEMRKFYKNKLDK